MFMAQQDPMGRYPEFKFEPVYHTEITDDEIKFEYFDNKPFEKIENNIFKTICHNIGVLCEDSTYIIIRKEKFFRLLKLCALQNIENDTITQVYYYIEHCESRRFQNKIKKLLLDI